jgi:hypothetical protein
MFISLIILSALGLGWLTKKLIKAYPNSPYPKRLEKRIRPLVNLAESLIARIKKFAS